LRYCWANACKFGTTKTKSAFAVWAAAPLSKALRKIFKASSKLNFKKISYLVIKNKKRRQIVSALNNQK
jgi:hypothetical protein